MGHTREPYLKVGTKHFILLVLFINDIQLVLVERHHITAVLATTVPVHVPVNVHHVRYEKRIEPELKQFLFPHHGLVVELHLDVSRQRQAVVQFNREGRVCPLHFKRVVLTQFLTLLRQLLAFLLQRLVRDGEAKAALAAHEVRHRVEDEFLDVHGDGRVVQVATQQLLVVANVPHLAGDGDAFLVLRARFAVVAEGVVGAGEHAAVQQVATNHGAGAAFACFAVHRRHVALVPRQPLLHVVAERLDGVDLGGVVVIEGEYLHPVVELGLVVAALRAQVVDVVVVEVFLVQELDHVVDVVAVDALDVGCRVTHGYDVVRDIWTRD